MASPQLAASGVQTFTTEEGAAGIAALVEKLTEALSGIEGKSKVDNSEGATSAAPQLVQVGSGFPALPKKLVEKVKANQYIDLPPAKGKSRPMSQALEGQVLVVQAADLLQSRRIIPDLVTWLQCFALYVAVLAPEQPERIADLMAYQALIAKASRKYKWPAWIVYDQNFRQEAAGKSQPWAKVDPGIYAVCFTGQAVSTENWCSHCQGLDHSTGNCPSNPRKRQWGGAANSWGGAANSPPQKRQSKQETQICLKFNKFNGDCRYGKASTCTYAVHARNTTRSPSVVPSQARNQQLNNRRHREQWTMETDILLSCACVSFKKKSLMNVG